VSNPQPSALLEGWQMRGELGLRSLVLVNHQDDFRLDLKQTAGRPILSLLNIRVVCRVRVDLPEKLRCVLSWLSPLKLIDIRNLGDIFVWINHQISATLFKKFKQSTGKVKWTDSIA
jgi:hypothetical protein